MSSREIYVITFSDQNGVYGVVAGETADEAWKAGAQRLLEDIREIIQFESDSDVSQTAFDQALAQVEAQQYAAAVATLVEVLNINENIFSTTLLDREEA